MNKLFIILPVVASLSGWAFITLAIRCIFHPLRASKLFGLSVQGLLPKKLPALATGAGQLAASMISLKQIEEKITHPENVKMIMPHAEEHIDNFLRVKLVKSMPVVGMFVGEKTINNLKSLFVKELEELFPQVMSAYMNNLEKDFDIGGLVAASISSYPISMLEKGFYMIMKKELVTIKVMGALAGLFIGIFQVLIILLIGH